MITASITSALLLSIFCSIALNKQHFAVLLVILASSQMTVHAERVIYLILFTAILQFAFAFFNAKQKKSFSLILLLPITYILAIFLIQPYKEISVEDYLAYLAALFVFAWIMLLEWDTKKIVEFLTLYGSYLILAGFLEIIFTSRERIGLALTVATAYAVILVVVWTIWAINSLLSKIYSIKVILLGTILMTLAIIFSGTRMGLLGMVMGFGLCGLSAIFIKNKKLNIIKLTAYSIGIMIALLALSIIVWNLLPESLFIKERFSTILAGKLDLSNMGRVLLWLSAINTFEQNPLLGVGAGNFSEQFRVFLMSIGIHERLGGGTHAHNLYLVVLSEHGLIGFLVLGSFVILCIKQLFSYFLKNRQDSNFYALISGFVIIAVLGLADAIPMYLPTACFAAWMLGVCASFRARSNAC
jgi:O-antigen ligase